MRVEDNLGRLGLAVPNLEELWRVNASGAHYISHFPVKGLLYLCGTTPVRDAPGFPPGLVGKDLDIGQGYEAARYAALTTLGVIKYALGDLDRVEQFVHLLCFVNSAPGLNHQPPVLHVR